jgi:hypothetical protein
MIGKIINQYKIIDEVGRGGKSSYLKMAILKFAARSNLRNSVKKNIFFKEFLRLIRQISAGP